MLFLLLTASVLAEKWGDLDKLANYRGKSEWEPWLRVKCGFAVMNTYDCFHCMAVPEGTPCNAKAADDYQYPGVCKKDPNAGSGGYARHLCYNAELPFYQYGIFTQKAGKGYNIPGAEAQALAGNRPEQLDFWTGKWWYTKESAAETVTMKTSESGTPLAVQVFAAIGLSALVYGAFRHYTQK